MAVAGIVAAWAVVEEAVGPVVGEAEARGPALAVVPRVVQALL
jgi:hypothetical protein